MPDQQWREVLPMNLATEVSSHQRQSGLVAAFISYRTMGQL
jgi:hypothetical protein